MTTAAAVSRHCTMPSTWLPGPLDPAEEHVLQTCDGVPRKCPSPEGPVPVAVCRAWLTTDPAARQAGARRCRRCRELVGQPGDAGS
jgi:hypothetical protein